MDEQPEIVASKPGDEPFTPPAELSDYDLQMIHAGLLIPNEKAVHSMSREIRKWRGVKDPDGV